MSVVMSPAEECSEVARPLPSCSSTDMVSSHFGEVRDILTALATHQVQSDERNDKLSTSVSELVTVAKTFSSDLTRMKETTSDLKETTSDLVRVAHKLNENMTMIEDRISSLEKNGARLEKNGARVARPGEEDTKRFIMNYLMRVGMDTRRGYMCACPVIVDTKCYVTISLGMLSTSFGKLLPNQRVPGVRNQEHFKRAFTAVPTQVQTKLAAVTEAKKILPLKQTPYNAREMAKWVVIPAEDFLEMCRDTLELDEEKWTDLDTIGSRNVIFTTLSCFDSSSIESFDDDTRERMAWKHKAWEDILMLDGMVEYRRLMAHHRNIDLASEPTHFSAYETFEDESVKRHPKAPRRLGKTRELVGLRAQKRALGTKGPICHSDISGSSESGSESDSGSDCDSGSESDNEEEPSRKRVKQGTLDDLCNSGGFN